jgi:hypothetical protein
VGVLEHFIADTQILRDPAQIFQLQGLAFARQIVELSIALRFEDALFGQSLK